MKSTLHTGLFLALSVLLMAITPHDFAKAEEQAKVKTAVKESSQLTEDHQKQSIPVIIDVRSKGKYFAGHVKEAISIPFYNVASEVPDLVTDKGQEIILYCNTGSKSRVSKAVLENLGYTNVKNGGGYSDMLNRGYSSEK